jgi:glycosyltransferase involved in cell wall biosynthesis
MKVLFLPAYFHPEQDSSSHLSNDREQALIDNGIDIVAYCATPTRGVSPSIRAEYKHRKKETLYNGHLTIYRFSLFKEGKSTIGRAFRYLVCSFKQFNRVLFSKPAKKCDVMWVSSTPPGKCALISIAGRIVKIPIVLNLQDIFPDSLVSTGMTHCGSLLWKIGRMIENYTYRNVDKIIVISKDFKNNLLKKGVPENKIVLIYNWVDEQAVIDIPRKDNILFAKYNLDPSRFYITYSGNIGLTQNMDMLLDVMSDLKEEAPDIRLVLIGEGAYKAQVEKIVAERDLNNVILLPFQPYEDISHVFSLGDAGLVISKPGVGANSVPSKTWSIMSASRPVLANFDENELKTIIEKNKCGIFTKAGCKDEFKVSIIELYNDQALCKEFGRNGRQFIMSNLTKKVGTQKFVDVIKSFEKK